MDDNTNKKTIQDDLYWQKMDELYASADKKNLIIAISRTDTEKFHLFTTMLRINNTLKKMVPNK